MALAALTQSLGGGVGAFFDYGRGRKESLKVQAQAAALRPVPGPVHTVGNQGAGGRVDAVNGLLETARQTFVATRRAKARELALQMIEHLPKQRSIMSALRSLFACESPLRLGGVALRTAKSFALCAGRHTNRSA